MGRVNVNLKVSDYSSRVLGVIKEKFGLRDKGQALDKFAELYGDEFVDREVKDEVVRDVIRSTEAHIRKHGFKAMTVEELDRLSGLP